MNERSPLEGQTPLAEAAETGPVQSADAVVAQAALIVELLESTTDSVVMLDRRWCFIYLNGRAQALIGGGRCFWAYGSLKIRA